MTAEEEFSSSLKNAAEKLKSRAADHSPVRIVSHSDADGIAAGAILSRTAIRLGLAFKATFENKIDEDLARSLSSEGYPLIIFSDIGGGYLDIFREHLSGKDVIVLDHHLYVDVDAPNVIHVNPLVHGLDGARGISGSGVSYLFSKCVAEHNIDLSYLGVLGALADQQDKGDRKTFIGLNRQIESDAKESGLLETKVDLIFYGYETRPIAKALANTTSPFIPGLSGREDGCLGLLKEAGIELKADGRWWALRDLSNEEKRAIFSAISKHMIYEGCSPEAVHQLLGTVYTLKAEESWTPMRDGREYASLLNACARMERPSIGLAICLGDRDTALKEGESTLDDYRTKISECLDWVRESGRMVEMENVYSLKAEGEVDERVIGVVASILLSTGILSKQMPLIAWARAEEGLVKVSGRATEEMSACGIDLGTVMMEAAGMFGGRGGGHDTAAGAFIPEKNEEGFLKMVDDLIGDQRKA